MKKLVAIALLSVAMVCGENWYLTATPQNALTCTVTNFPGAPAYYSIYFGTNGTMRRYTSMAMPVPFTNFIKDPKPALYSMYVTVTSTNGVETLPSANTYVYWIAPPAVPGAPTAVGIK